MGGKELTELDISQNGHVRISGAAMVLGYRRTWGGGRPEESRLGA